MQAWMLVAFCAGLILSGIVIVLRRFTPALAGASNSAPTTAGRPQQDTLPSSTAGAFRPDPYEVWVRALGTAPHLAILGPTGSGKTVLAEAILRSRAGQVLIIDPNYEEGDWGGLPVVTTDDDDSFKPIERAFQALLAEMRSRVVRARRGEKDFAELTIVWDGAPC